MIFSVVVMSTFLVACDNTMKINENNVNEKTKTVKIKSNDDNPLTYNTRKTNISHYTVYANGTAVDKNTNMMWARCAIGQEWDSDNLTCTGKAKTYNWSDAFKAIETLNAENYLGYSDWQLPHIEDLSNLRYCSDDFKETTKIPTKAGGEKEVERRCKGDNYQKPTIDKRVFPNTNAYFYWSSSPYSDDGDYAWGVYFDGGYDLGNDKHDDCSVRAVRENRPK